MPDFAEEGGSGGNCLRTPKVRLGGKNSEKMTRRKSAWVGLSRLGDLRRDQVARAISARMKRAAQTNNSAPSMVVTVADSSE